MKTVSKLVWTHILVHHEAAADFTLGAVIFLLFIVDDQWWTVALRFGVLRQKLLLTTCDYCICTCGFFICFDALKHLLEFIVTLVI